MTSRERLLQVLSGKIPDCVPVAPDFSNMIPARLTGKPFWDLYLYNDPPIWEAYIACAKHFDIDAVMDGYFPLTFPEEINGPQWERVIVYRNSERIVTQSFYWENGKRVWSKRVDVFYRDNPPTRGVLPETIQLPATPAKWEPLEGVKSVDLGPSGLKRVKELMGDQGLVGVWGGTSTAAFGRDIEGIYNYYDHPERHESWIEGRIKRVEQRMKLISEMEVRPDFLCFGGSGTLVFATVAMFEEIALPSVIKGIELATRAGFFTHVHSCGPEKELVRILAETTDLTVIDPLEIPPMGDCNLAELKRLYGHKITLKGNLHTTEVMLKGSTQDVITASKAAIDAAAAGGRFILSTGDQCGRDTPDSNLYAMVDTARTYGRYR